MSIQLLSALTAKTCICLVVLSAERTYCNRINILFKIYIFLRHIWFIFRLLHIRHDCTVFHHSSYDGAVFDKSGSVLIAVPMAKEFNAPEGTLFFAPYCYAYSRMSEIKLPSTLANIVDYTFVKCENLESIDIPESVQGIGTEAFKDCYSLKKVHIPASVETMGEDVFTGCDVDLVIELDTVDCQAYIYAKTHEIPIKCPLTASVGLETEFVEDEEYSAMPLGLPVKVTGYAEGGSDDYHKSRNIRQ